MGNSYFYYYPAILPGGRAPLAAIDMGRRVGSLDRIPQPMLSVGESLSGREAVQVWRVAHGYDIIFDGLADLAVVRKIERMVNHLRRGGLIGFSADHSKTFAAFRGSAAVVPNTDLSGISFTGVTWYNWQSSPTLTTSDVVAVQGIDRGQLGRYSLSSLDIYADYAAMVTLSENMQTAVEAPVLLREQYTLPALRLRPSDRMSPSLLTSRAEHTWRLALPLVEDLHALRHAGLLPGTSGLPTSLAGSPYAPPV